MHGYEQYISLTLEPLSVLYLQFVPVKKRQPKKKSENPAVEFTDNSTQLTFNDNITSNDLTADNSEETKPKKKSDKKKSVKKSEDKPETKQ